MIELINTAVGVERLSFTTRYQVHSNSIGTRYIETVMPCVVACVDRAGNQSINQASKQPINQLIN